MKQLAKAIHWQSLTLPGQFLLAGGLVMFIAIQEAVNIGFPIENFIGNW